MFKLFKKLFGKADTKIAPSPSSNQVTPASGAQKPDAASGVEVASLSLRAILDRFPADLKSTINEMPGIDAKVVLPVNAIMKQLPSGTVKMSLASLHRQAPSGTFRKTNFEEKRMVEVPLAEVFKSINPARLQRRTDQRHYEVPEEITGLFGEDGSSRSVTQPVSQIPAPAAPAATTVQPPKALKMPATTAAAAAAAPAPSKVVAPAPALKMPAPSSVVTPPARSSIIKPPAAPVSGGDALKLEGDLSISLTEAAASWDESVRNQLSVLSGDTKVALPVADVGPGLQKGKVIFTWAQIRNWLQPAASAAITIEDSTPLLFPLKLIAPAFIAATGAKKRQSAKEVSNEVLPDFFGPAAGQKPKPAPAPAAPEPAPEPVAAPAPVAKVETPVAIIAPAAAPTPAHEPQNIGELFSQADKTDWTPTELIKATCSLPGVAGAVIALEEGLVVAQKLPENLAADTMAAFMPQIFSRIDRYTGEMQLGDTSEVRLQTAQGPCHFFRLGKVFFATLGRNGENLPAGLKLVAEEIARQNS